MVGSDKERVIDKQGFRPNVGIVVVNHHFPDEPVNAFLVLPYKQVKSLIPAFNSFEFFQYFLVFLIQTEIVSGLGGQRAWLV